MKRIIIHWSAGTYMPNSVDLEHYHFLVDDKGKVYNGKYKPEDNLNCNDGRYAAHTGGGNTGSIGIALCAMLGYKDIKNVGKYLIKPVQIEALYQKCAELCRQYNIPITSDTVMTHYEFGLKNPNTSSKGKIDIVYLPTNPSLTCAQVGDFIRGKIKWYYGKL